MATQAKEIKLLAGGGGGVDKAKWTENEEKKDAHRKNLLKELDIDEVRADSKQVGSLTSILASYEQPDSFFWDSLSGRTPVKKAEAKSILAFIRGGDLNLPRLATLMRVIDALLTKYDGEKDFKELKEMQKEGRRVEKEMKQAREDRLLSFFMAAINPIKEKLRDYSGWVGNWSASDLFYQRKLGYLHLPDNPDIYDTIVDLIREKDFKVLSALLSEAQAKMEKYPEMENYMEASGFKETMIRLNGAVTQLNKALDNLASLNEHELEMNNSLTESEEEAEVECLLRPPGK